MAGTEDDSVSIGLSSHKCHCDAGHFRVRYSGTGVHDESLGYNGSFEVELLAATQSLLENNRFLSADQHPVFGVKLQCPGKYQSFQISAFSL